MATTLRLDDEAQQAVRTEAARSGRTQQAFIREAVDNYFGLSMRPSAVPGSIDDLVKRSILIPPTEPVRRAGVLLTLADGVTSLDLMQREDRI